MKLLAFGDDPSGATGYSRQAKNILTRFHKQGFQIAMIGINRVDESALRPFEDDRMPFKVFRADIDPTDPSGRNLLMRAFGSIAPDVLFVMGDVWSFRGWFAPWLQEQQFRIPFKTIGYYSCEYPLNHEDLAVLSATDIPVCHSKWGLNFENEAGFDEIKKKVDRLIYIPDTVDSKTFFFSSEEQRETDRASIGIMPSHYVIMNVNRNTTRKDISATLSAFRRVKKEIQEAKLYLHAAPLDEWVEGERIDLRARCELEGLRCGDSFERADVIFPRDFNPRHGYPEDLLRRLYGCADLFISTSLSEGFGVTPVEALFCGRPILVPGHTGFSNLCETVGLTPVRYYSAKAERVAPHPVYKTDEDDLVNRIMGAFEARNKPSFRGDTMLQAARAVEAFDADKVFDRSWMPIVHQLQASRQPIQAVLFVQRGSAGDVFLSTSVLPGLRARHPGLPIHYMTQAQYANIVEGLVDEIIPWQPSLAHDYAFSYLPHEHRIFRGNWGAADSPLAKLYSEILNLPYHPPQIAIDPISGLPPEYIVVHGTGGHPYRNYYNFHMALDGCRLPIVQIGGKEDQILGNGDFTFIDLRGKLSYRQAAYVISKATLFVGVDSYPMHVAGSFNIPMVVTFGSGAARVTAPMTKGATRFLEPVYSKVCPIAGPCYGNFNCPRPCGPMHSPELVRLAIKDIMPGLFPEKKKTIVDVNKRLMELLKKPSRKESKVV